MDKQQIIKNVVAIILKHAKPERIYMYGSQVSGDASDVSDIDIAYSGDEYSDHAAILAEVATLNTLLKIDVTNLKHTEERFRNRVISTGRVLYSASKQLRAEDGLYNFSRALDRFISVLTRREELFTQGFGDVFLDTAVKRFEFIYEMSWKCIKRYLDFIGIEAQYPRITFKEAYALKLITNEAVWLDMIESRNLSSHIYDENEISQLLVKLDDYKQAFLQLRDEIKSQLENKK